MAGFLSDAMAIPNLFMSQIGNLFTSLGNFVQQFMSFEIIGFLLIIGKCIFAGIMFVVQFWIWIFYFLLWLIYPPPKNLKEPKPGDKGNPVGFIWWLVRYIIVIAYKITSLPKCFIWYFIDTATWTMYLPFRFIFWVLDMFLDLGIEKAEHKTWDFFDQIDYFIHGKPNSNYFMYQYEGGIPPTDIDGNDPDAMNLGLHVIHFPDSVMEQCYSLSPYLLEDLKPFPMDAFMAFISCAMNPF
jgi:hypothetical protein